MPTIRNKPAVWTWSPLHIEDDGSAAPACMDHVSAMSAFFAVSRMPDDFGRRITGFAYVLIPQADADSQGIVSESDVPTLDRVLCRIEAALCSSNPAKFDRVARLLKALPTAPDTVRAATHYAITRGLRLTDAHAVYEHHGLVGETKAGVDADLVNAIVDHMTTRWPDQPRETLEAKVLEHLEGTA